MPVTASQPTRGYRSIRRRMLLALLLLSLTPLVVLGVFCLNRVNAIYDEKITAGLEAVTSSKRRALDTFIEERLAQIKTLVFTHSFEELSDTTKLSQIFSVVQNNSRSFVDMGIIGMDGRHVAYVGPFDLKAANYVEALWFLEVQRRGVVISDVFMGYRQVPHFIIAVLRHEAGRTYIIRATIDMEAIDALLRREYSGGNSEAFLLNEKGVLQTNTRHYGKIMDTFALPSSAGASGNVQTIPLSAATGLGSSDGGMLAAWARLSSIPWYLVVVDDVRGSLLPLRQLQVLIMCFLAAGCVLVVAGAIFCTRSMVSYLSAADEKQAQIDARMLQSSKMAALGKMAAGVAHEVNNPLMLIQENAGWICDLLEEESPQAIKNYQEILNSTKKIEQHVSRAKGITQRMLGFGRRMNPGRAEILINSLLDEACEMLRAEAANRNITITRNFDSQLPVIYSDPAQLEQVFINIIDNAIDAIGKNGTIDIRSSLEGEDGVRVSIADDGPGMSAETRKHIFDPFFTTKKVGEGTGLGLAICFSILEKLGGHIEVKSAPGEGTTFMIVLPHEPPSDQTAKGLEL